MMRVAPLMLLAACVTVSSRVGMTFDEIEAHDGPMSAVEWVDGHAIVAWRCRWCEKYDRYAKFKSATGGAVFGYDTINKRWIVEVEGRCLEFWKVKHGHPEET